MSDPEYAISIQPGYVLVDDPPDYEVIWSEQPAKMQAIFAACSEAGVRKVLIRGSNTHVKLTSSQMLGFGQEIAKLHLQIAILNLSDASVEDGRFISDVATNRGSRIRFFENEQEAKDWLKV